MLEQIQAQKQENLIFPNLGNPTWNIIINQERPNNSKDKSPNPIDK